MADWLHGRQWENLRGVENKAKRDGAEHTKNPIRRRDLQSRTAIPIRADPKIQRIMKLLGSPCEFDYNRISQNGR